MTSESWVLSLDGAITALFYTEQGLFLEFATICPIRTWLRQPVSLKTIAEY